MRSGVSSWISWWRKGCSHTIYSSMSDVDHFARESISYGISTTATTTVSMPSNGYSMPAFAIELPRAGLAGRRIHLLCRDDFEFSGFGNTFDFAIAQSVFTHLTWNSILRCLYNIRMVLHPRGQFFATFFEDSDGTHHVTPIQHMPSGVMTYPDKDPYHYPFDVFAELARRTGLDIRYIGAWHHPRNQKMMVFTLPRPT